VSALRAILGIGPPGTPDSESGDVRARIEEEIAFHLDERASEIERQEGVPTRTARELARARFGDTRKISKQCERIALWEKNMLQRINTVMSVLLLAGLVYVGWLAYSSNQRTGELLAGVSESIEQLKEELGGRAGEGDEPVEGAEVSDRSVYITGDVANPGAYEVPAAGLSLGRLILTAGGTTDEAGSSAGPLVTVKRGGEKKQIVAYEALYRNMLKSDSAFELVPSDTIRVRNAFQAKVSPASKDSPRQFTVEGAVERPGAWYMVNQRQTMLTNALHRAGIYIVSDESIDVDVIRPREGLESETLEFTITGKPYMLSIPDALIYPGDQIRVYEHGREHGEADIQCAAIEVGGELKAHGWYHIEEAITVADALALAGGVTPPEVDSTFQTPQLSVSRSLPERQDSYGNFRSLQIANVKLSEFDGFDQAFKVFPGESVSFGYTSDMKYSSVLEGRSYWGESDVIRVLTKRKSGKLIVRDIVPHTQDGTLTLSNLRQYSVKESSQSRVLAQQQVTVFKAGGTPRVFKVGRSGLGTIRTQHGVIELGPGDRVVFREL